MSANTTGKPPGEATIGSVTLEHRSATSGLRRLAALTEVILAFALVHLCWRSFKHFTWLGRIEAQARQNYSAGFFMIVFALIAIKCHGGALAEYGLHLGGWRRHLNVGIFWGVVAPLTLLVVLLLSGFHPKNFVHPGTPWPLALVGSFVAIAYALVYSRTRTQPRWTPPLAVSLVLLTALWSIFFRGYVLTRLDLSFGRPLSLWGVPVGVGLLVSSLLFGLVHALNTVDYFAGRYQFDWPSGVFSCCVGVFYATMRQRTGSIFPGAIAHGIGDVLTRISG